MLNPALLPSTLIVVGWLFLGAMGEPAEAAPPQETGTTVQPEMATLKSTFIPGDKTLFFDDLRHDRGRRAAAFQGPRICAGVEGGRQHPAIDHYPAGIDFPHPPAGELTDFITPG